MKKIFLLLAMVATALIISRPATGQNVDITKSTIAWQSKKIEDLKNDNKFKFVSEVKSYGNTHIDWIQKNGLLVHSFQITGTEGDWPDVSLPGKLTYQVTYEGSPGEICFERVDNDVTVTCTVHNIGCDETSYRLKINDIHIE